MVADHQGRQHQGRLGVVAREPIMSLSRRRVLHLAAGAVAVPAVTRIASAQSYPTRPITMIVPFPAGGGTDVNGRVVADRMSGSLGRPIIIENISGADGSIGTGRVARARPDGYTMSRKMRSLKIDWLSK
jgi:tripartite-type tricarboxylate transporter receptor subunit TctC